MNDANAPNTAHRVAVALSLFRLEVLDASIALMTNNSANFRLESIRMLGLSERPLKPALRPLIQCLQDTEAAVAAAAAGALGKIAMEPALVVPALTASLKDERQVVKKAIMRALGAFHTDARSAIPALLAFLKDPDPKIGMIASETLLQIDFQALEQAQKPE
jgi:HEAT repeat protein